MRKTPFSRIEKTVSSLIPSQLVCYLPQKWEKIGTVVTMKVPEELSPYKEIIGKVYADTLGCTTTLNDLGGISGVYRKPVVEVIFGSPITETIHVENGIRFKVDPQKIMFSSGNMTERRRMGMISHPKETVVDLFAGIGYFTLPIAVYSKPKKIVACEINPVAFEYLCANVGLNHVSSFVEPRLGDNRHIAPKDYADRVILGFLHEPQAYLPVAFECLKDHTGFLHYHTLASVDAIPQQPLTHLNQAASCCGCQVNLLKVTVVKSYAPKINHVVLDVRVWK
jgi:tRNA wybutosine-synthesizing protein 2